MAEIYKLRMLSDENDNFLREYEVPVDYTLLDLHEFISRDLGYDNDGMTSFFASDARWDKLLEFTLMDMGEGGPVPMQDVKLKEVLSLPQARLIYQFDMFNDRALYLESTGSATADGSMEYPRVTLSKATPPDQYESGERSDEGSIFDEAMGEFNEFQGDDSYDDEF